MSNLSEHDEQCFVINWLDHLAVNMWPQYRMPDGKLLYYAVPNGGKRHIRTAKKLKQEGTRSGIPDLSLPIPVGQYHGLYIEMKKQKGGSTSKEQKMWIDALRKMNYRVEVANGHKVAIDLITRYLNDEE